MSQLNIGVYLVLQAADAAVSRTAPKWQLSICHASPCPCVKKAHQKIEQRLSFLANLQLVSFLFASFLFFLFSVFFFFVFFFYSCLDIFGQTLLASYYICFVLLGSLLKKIFGSRLHSGASRKCKKLGWIFKILLLRVQRLLIRENMLLIERLGCQFIYR